MELVLTGNCCLELSFLWERYISIIYIFGERVAEEAGVLILPNFLIFYKESFPPSDKFFSILTLEDNKSYVYLSYMI